MEESWFTLTIYSFEFTVKMKTSYFCGLLLSALMVQISSAEISEFDKITTSLMHSLVDIMEIPYRKIENILDPSVAGKKKEPFLKDIVNKFNQKKEQIEKNYLESRTSEEREFIKKKLVDYSNASQKLVNAIWDASNTAKMTINGFFNTLPKNVQNKVLDLGKDLNNILHKIKA
ncbi:uncharacterized protein LOC112598629 isoform X2 [Melanaphis sacchari]|uniref:uncharacterized protein LOC112598629 isoform X2 n=1 Tax=Melanaphis sacchari TaxID=742174 RepID=UPI000DC13A57|nr:uncharacterized protein LOC112598629 isoform X2 [Melanaphis sacchari]